MVALTGHTESKHRAGEASVRKSLSWPLGETVSRQPSRLLGRSSTATCGAQSFSGTAVRCSRASASCHRMAGVATKKWVRAVLALVIAGVDAHPVLLRDVPLEPPALSLAVRPRLVRRPRCFARTMGDCAASARRPTLADDERCARWAFAGTLAVRLDWVSKTSRSRRVNRSPQAKRRSALGRAEPPPDARIGVNDTGAIAYSAIVRRSTSSGLTTPPKDVIGSVARLTPSSTTRDARGDARALAHALHRLPEWMGLTRSSAGRSTKPSSRRDHPRRANHAACTTRAGPPSAPAENRGRALARGHDDVDTPISETKRRILTTSTTPRR